MQTSEFIKVADQLSGFRPYFGPHGAAAGGLAGALVGGAAGGVFGDEEEPLWKRLLKGGAIGATVGAVGGSGASVGARNLKLSEGWDKLDPKVLSALPGPKGDQIFDTLFEGHKKVLKDTEVPWKNIPGMVSANPKHKRDIFEHNKPMREEAKKDITRQVMEILTNNKTQ